MFQRGDENHVMLISARHRERVLKKTQIHLEVHVDIQVPMDRISLMLTAGERVERTVQYDQTSAIESSSFSFNGVHEIHHQ